MPMFCGESVRQTWNRGIILFYFYKTLGGLGHRRRSCNCGFEVTTGRGSPQITFNKLCNKIIIAILLIKRLRLLINIEFHCMYVSAFTILIYFNRKMALKAMLMLLATGLLVVCEKEAGYYCQCYYAGAINTLPYDRATDYCGTNFYCYKITGHRGKDTICYVKTQFKNGFEDCCKRYPKTQAKCGKY